MSDNSQIFFNKKILIYGLGKSGLSSFNFLRNKNDVYLFDDNPNLKINKSIKKKTDANIRLKLSNIGLKKNSFEKNLLEVMGIILPKIFKFFCF